MGLVDGKVVLVTGAGSGIGRASALLFASEGARGVCCVDVDPTAARTTADLVRAGGAKALDVACDVSDATQVVAMMAACIDAFGRLDCAHNNAGVAPRPQLTAAFTDDEWRRTVDVVLTGTWLCMKHEIHQMLQQGGGAIVNTSSTAGFTASPGMSPYVAAKHGVLGLTRNAALEYVRSGVRVNAVCPGATLTGMMRALDGGTGQLIDGIARVQPGGRISDPREQAEAAVWLCSDRASFVTGVALPVDNGATLGASVNLAQMWNPGHDT